MQTAKPFFENEGGYRKKLPFLNNYLNPLNIL